MSGFNNNTQGNISSYVVKTPRYGGGSEYRQGEKAEARRKRLGIHLKQYRQEDQPWILSVSGKKEKKYKGCRVGGVSENSSWYIFMQGKDGSFEAYPVEEWHSYRPIQHYKSLTEDEAEKHFERRSKIMNYFPLMKKETHTPDGEEEPTKQKNRSFLGNRLVLSEIDDWMSESDSGDELEEENQDDDTDRKKKNKYKVQSKGRKQQGGKKQKKVDGESDDEDCIEESDEYDNGAEHDYISSDSSDSEAEDDEVVRRELAGVDEADALRKLINSDEDDEEEERDEDEPADDPKNNEKNKDKKKKRDKKSDNKEDLEGKILEGNENVAGRWMKKIENISLIGKTNLSQNGNNKKKTKKELKRGVQNNHLDTAGTAASSASRSDNNVSEDTIRRYLSRKPMTTTELLQKFKVKKTGLGSDHLVHSIAQILKKLNPVKQVVKGKMYLSLN
ncbi:general transcription factor IIF subunit 1-like isoform X2 [Palaemon carinicauda]|uniref:general transcription factor IIF subunit 1-like isoform X2 n=1 Tax=Palaemon carinicauda TaxID=392227 RepID=UPI0035B6A896